VTGLDASEEAVNIAQEHAKTDPDLLSRLSYKHGSLEDVAESHECSFDAVVVSEVIEHMASAEQCVKLCSQLIKVIT
jgi:2-polyprenyl-3-methyl-5-hydroxy-6-metoxy-1,4-benzoquinol methylase